MVEKLTGVKVLFVVAPSGFDGDELEKTARPLEAAGATTVLASPAGGEAVSSGGQKVSTVAITEPRSTELAGMVIIGGQGALQHVAGNELVQKVVRMIERDGKPIGALSLGTVVLARAGVLSGKSATTWVTSESLKAFKEAGARYEKKAVVLAGSVMTADGAASADRFAVLFLDLLSAFRARSASGRVTR